MNITAIQARLTQIRKDEDAALAARAREEYGAEFDKMFTYKKSGIIHVKTKACDVAKQYRILKGIENINEDDD